jgi:regulator of nucleoside diphosphate kinase
VNAILSQPATAETGEHRLLITNSDLERLRELIVEEKRWEPRGNEYLHRLEREMAAARILPPDAIPADVVTMNSTVRLLDLDSRETMDLTLVFPDDANVDEDKISVLAPIGTAVLGYRAGDEIAWPVPDGVRRLKVVEVLYQPEAAGEENP